MANFLNFEIKDGIIPILRTIALIVILLFLLSYILGAIKKRLLKRAKTKKQISNIEIFTDILKYMVWLFIIISAIFTYSGSWTGLGLTVGLISAALGWALQKPITGIAAWLMIVVRRPFEIGDRVIIGDVKGDVVDITLTHIYIGEVGGIVSGEENSKRIVMVPNSSLFEQNIVNYTLQDQFVLDQVAAVVTFDSNVDKATKIFLDAAKKHMKEYSDMIKQEPYIRTFFKENGINVHVRYLSPAQRIQEFSSRITKEVWEQVMKTKDVEFAYPHTKIVLGDKARARFKKART